MNIETETPKPPPVYVVWKDGTQRVMQSWSSFRARFPIIVGDDPHAAAKQRPNHVIVDAEHSALCQFLVQEKKLRSPMWCISRNGKTFNLFSNMFYWIHMMLFDWKAEITRFVSSKHVGADVLPIIDRKLFNGEAGAHHMRRHFVREFEGMRAELRGLSFTETLIMSMVQVLLTVQSTLEGMGDHIPNSPTLPEQFATSVASRFPNLYASNIRPLFPELYLGRVAQVPGLVSP